MRPGSRAAGRPPALPPPPNFRGRFRDDPLARAAYAEGAGIVRIIPDAVAVPADTDDIAALVTWAAQHDTALIPRGSGSGMAGAATGRGVIVDCSRLEAIGAVDVERRTIRCAPGALRGAVDAAARTHGLRFPVDPSSGPFCTVGGMVATNAAGARSLRFGATRPWVEALDVVLADGTRARLNRGATALTGTAIDILTRDVLPRWRGNAGLRHPVRKESSGYAVADAAESGDPLDLFAGSEGTLAVFTGIELRLTPVAPATASALAAFDSLDDAAVAAARAALLGATACELLDRTFLDVAAAASAIPVEPRTEAVLLIEAEGESSGEAAATINALADACRLAGATAVELALAPDAERALWSLRHAASPTLAGLDPSLRSMQFIEDACVPLESLPVYVRGVRAALAARDIRGVIFGHAGDANVHVNPLIDVRRRGWKSDVAGVLEEVTSLVASLGGTLTGEHGDGRLRSPLMPRVWSTDALACFAEIKRTLDPRGILNPGVKTCAADAEPPLDEIKYDPELPPLPPRARAALDHIERERAYARLRFDLIAEV